jgi:hypothetical protein
MNRRWKAARVSGLTVWATDRFALLFLNPEAHFRQSKDVTVCDNSPCDCTQIPTALAADVGTVTHHVVDGFPHRERLSSVACWTSWTLFTGTTSTAWLALRPVRRGWLVAHSTVFCQVVFSLFDPGWCLGPWLFSGKPFREQRLEGALLFSKGLPFFVFRHGCPFALG